VLNHSEGREYILEIAMAWFWKQAKETSAAAAPKSPTTTTMAIAGHGLLLAPACPCRVATLRDTLIFGRGFDGPLISEALVSPNTRPAIEPPTLVGPLNQRTGPSVYGTGPNCPTITIEQPGASIDELFVEAVVGCGEAPWNVLVSGFWFELPNLVLYSPATATDLPELHLPTHVGAMISFGRVDMNVDAIAARWNVGQTLDLCGQVFHCWQYEYSHEGEPWLQRKIALPFAADRSIVLSAQAPTPVWPQLAAAAELIAGSFEPAQ
jgi:hypothetical protein